MARNRRPGTNYADVDAVWYGLLDQGTPIQIVQGRGAGVSGRSLRDWMAGAAVVVVGSVVPWYEVLALESGAAFTLTLEYNEVHYDDQRRGRGNDA